MRGARVKLAVQEDLRQENDPERESAFVNCYLAISPRASAALLGAVASGRSLPDVLSLVVEEWARGKLGRVVR